MLTLCLYRHAKSAWDDPTMGDFERPLNARGRAAAAQMGRYLAEHHLMPDLVLSSPAMRTRETCARTFAELPAEPAVRFEPPLYLASSHKILDVVRETAESVKTLMIVGHNPGLHELSMELIGEGAAAAIALLREKLPTAALVVIRFEAQRWADIQPRAGRLDGFVTPRSLPV